MSAGLNPADAGSFATSRRGGLTPAEIREIEAHRAKPRPTPWQALQERYGRPVAELQAAVAIPEMDAKPVAFFENMTTWETRRFWNADRINQLRDLFMVQGLSAQATSEALGCTREAVIGKASRLGLKKADAIRGQRQ